MAPIIGRVIVIVCKIISADKTGQGKVFQTLVNTSINNGNDYRGTARGYGPHLGKVDKTFLHVPLAGVIGVVRGRCKCFPTIIRFNIGNCIRRQGCIQVILDG